MIVATADSPGRTDIMEQLEALGASAILETRITNCRLSNKAAVRIVQVGGGYLELAVVGRPSVGCFRLQRRVDQG